MKLHEFGLTIIVTENSKILIKMSPLSTLQGRLCGLCGNNNYDTSDDMTSLSSKMPVYNSRMFVMDNVLPSATCDATDYESHLGLRHEGFCKYEKTVKIERTIRGVEEVCFSKQPVTVCRHHCTAESTTPRNVRFVCLPRYETTAERLLSKDHSGVRVLTDELSSVTSPTIEEEIYLPEKCTTNY
jgi:hypothetical protein